MQPTLVPPMPSCPNQTLTSCQNPHSKHSKTCLIHLATLLSLFDLSLGAPDALEETVSLGQSVQGVVALAHRSDEAAEGIGVVLALNGTAVLVNLRNRDLDGAVVLGLDDAVGGAALAGDVAE